MAKKDKASIYVDAYNLFQLLYKVQFDAPKRDRPLICKRILDHCEGVLANYALAYKTNEKIKYINIMLAEVESLTIECRMAIELKIFPKDKDNSRIRELLVSINESVVKWRAFVISQEQHL